MSSDYPLNSESSHIKCNFEVKSLHGSRIKMTPVDVTLEGGCADNKLTILDDSPVGVNSSLQFPGLSASCGQSSIPDSTRPITSDGTVSLQYLRTSNSGKLCHCTLIFHFNIEFLKRHRQVQNYVPSHNTRHLPQ